MEHLLQAIVTVLALVNPVVCAALFERATATQSRRAKVVAATMAAVTVLVILMLAALFGAKVLHTFGVSIAAFSVAGGGVLAWIGFGMLSGGGTSQAADSSDQAAPNSSDPDPTDPAPPQPSLTPLILFAASPGTITGVITLAVAHSKTDLPVTAMIAVAVATVVMWLVLLLAILLGSRKQTAQAAGKAKAGQGFIRDTITRFMGLIVIAMGVQFVLSGLQSFFHFAGAQ